MIIPIGTDRDGRRPAIAVSTIIVLNILAYWALRSGAGMASSATDPVSRFIQVFGFDPEHPRWWTFITAAFCHDPGSIWHIAGNMLFLWVFGKPLESHIGTLRFAGLYLTGAVVSFAGHMLASDAPAIGASGAVSAVTGAFIALFPRSRTVILFLLGMSVFSVPSMWLIGAYFALDVISQVLEWTHLRWSGVATMAHISGLIYGIAAGLLMLRLRIVPRSDADLLYVLTQARRRAAMRRATRGANPWAGGAPRGSIAAGGRVQGAEARVAEARARVQALLTSPNPQDALPAWAELRAIAPDEVLPADAQLAIANLAFRADATDAAVAGYERFLASYPTHTKADEVRLLLAVAFIRRLGEPAKGKPLLDGLAGRLSDASQRSLALALDSECHA